MAVGEDDDSACGAVPVNTPQLARVLTAPREHRYSQIHENDALFWEHAARIRANRHAKSAPSQLGRYEGLRFLGFGRTRSVTLRPTAECVVTFIVNLTIG